MPEGYFIKFYVSLIMKRFFENYWSVMSAILHGVTIICCSQETWQFFVTNTVVTNISAELLYVYVQCLVISLECLK